MSWYNDKNDDMIQDEDELKDRLKETKDYDSVFRKVYKRIKLSADFIDFLKENGIKTSMDMVKAIGNNYWLKYDVDVRLEKKIKTLSPETYKKRRMLIDKLGAVVYGVEEDSPLFSDYMLDTFGVDNIVHLYKHGYLTEKESSIGIDFDKLLNKDNIESFISIYKDFLEHDEEELDIVSFLDTARKYLKNPDLFNEIMRNNPDKDLSACMKQYFLQNCKNIKISSVDDIRNIDKLLFDEFDAEVNKGYLSYGIEDGYVEYSTIQLINGEVTKFITGKRDVNNLFYGLNDDKIQKLADSLEEKDDDKDLETLANIQLILNLRRKFNFKHKDATEFAEIFSKELTTEEKNIILDSYKSAERNITRIYETELRESVSSISSIIEAKENGELPNSELREEKLDEESSVKYLILREPVTLVQHVMNAYNFKHEKGSLDLFLDGPGLVYVPYFSTSTITNESQTYLDSSKNVGKYGTHKIENENDVVILFDSIPRDSLVKFGPSDCAIESRENNIESLTSFTVESPSRYGTSKETIEETIKKGENATEYAFFMHKLLKPAAIRVIGDEPIEAEIKAAEKLGIPLVKLEKSIEKSEKKLIKKDLKPNPRLKEVIDKVEKIFERVNGKKITKDQIGKRTRAYNERLYEDCEKSFDDLNEDKVFFE